jgi:hypothetical protein
MLVGDAERFAIELEPLTNERSERWAHIRLWVESNPVGYLDDVDAIDYIAGYFRRFLAKSRSVVPGLEGLGPEEAFRFVFKALYGKGTGIRGAEAERRFRGFVLAPNGMACFDGTSVAVFNLGDGQRVVSEEAGGTRVVSLAAGECERVIEEFLGWLEQSFDVAGPSS